MAVNTPLLLIYSLLDGSEFDTQRHLVSLVLYSPIVTLFSLWLYATKHGAEIDACLSYAIERLEQKENAGREQ